jgi:hypothetical protein
MMGNRRKYNARRLAYDERNKSLKLEHECIFSRREIESLRRQLSSERELTSQLKLKVSLFRKEIQILKDAMLRLEGFIT